MDTFSELTSLTDGARVGDFFDSNKENPYHHRRHQHQHQVCASLAKIEPFDVSLVEGLSAIHQKLDRLRLDKKEMEKMLRHGDSVLETNMKELFNKGAGGFSNLNKENSHHRRRHQHQHQVCASPAKIELFDASLAEELNAIRQKLEWLRLDRKETKKMLRVSDSVLETNMKELFNRGKAQKQLKIEVNRLFRSKELKSSSSKSL